MGPYAFTQAFLSGFFGFAAVTAFAVWSRTRRDRSLLILAVSAGIWSVQSTAVLLVASSETIEEARRALALRTEFGALGVAATAWIFSEVTGVRARAFLWFVTITMVAISVVTAAGVPLVGSVTALERVPLPWGEMFSVNTRTEPYAVVIPT